MTGDPAAAGAAVQVSELCRTDECVVAAVSGAMDYFTQYDFCAAVQGLLVPSGRRLVLELSGVDFLDSSGLNELLRLRRRAAGAGGSLVLAAVPLWVQELLALTGTDSLLPVYDPAADACGGPHQHG
ncbi:STAS domain-containing protein [Streptomyces seoulensis]